MAGLPVNFRTGGEGAVASYDWVDIADGTGVRVLYAYTSETSGGADYHLSSDATIYSKEKESSDASAANPTIDLDFDLPAFNLPQTIRGNALIIFCQSGIGGAGSEAGNLVTTIRVRKWDGTTETEIANAVAPTLNWTTDTDVKEINTIPITIPKTLFKKGENLRLSFFLQGTRTSGSANPTIAIGHDPLNRDGVKIVPSTDTPATITKLIFYCPFNIDL